MDMRKIYDWKAIQEYHDLGHGFSACQRHFKFSHTAWVKALRRGELVGRLRSAKRTTTSADRRRTYNWAAIQRYYDEGHSYHECRERFGFYPQSWDKARRRGEIKVRPKGIPLAELWLSTSRKNVKSRFTRAGLLTKKCAFCGISEWRGKALTLHLDHINGIRNDHRLENLRMLCPNCHSQTATYGGRNKKRMRLLQDATEFA